VLVDKHTYVVPVSFGDGASWANVMDHYELSDASKACLASGHAKLSVGSDGGRAGRRNSPPFLVPKLHLGTPLVHAIPLPPRRDGTISR